KVAELLRAMAAERGASAESARRRRRHEARDRLEKAEKRLLEVDTRFLDGDLDRESHARLLAHYRSERDAASIALAEVEAAVTAEALHVRYAVAELGRLRDVWRGGRPEARDGLVGSIWPAGLVLAGRSYRTPGGESLIGLLGGVRAENGKAPVRVDRGRPVWRAREDSNPRPSDP